MKKLFKILLVITLLFTINVYADGIEETLYKEISTKEELEEVKNLPYLKEILIKNLTIEDMSILNNLKELEKINIFYSRVNFNKFNNSNIKEVNIISSYIINDDLSSLTNSNIKKLDLEGSYITSIYSIKNIISLEELGLNSISNLRSLEPITYLPNLKVLNFKGSEDLINNKVFNYIKEHNIIGKNYDSSKYMYLNGEEYSKKLEDIIESLNLKDLRIIEKIQKITLYVTSHIEYDDRCGVDNICDDELEFNTVAKALSGKGICYDYALLTNRLLNKAGIKSYLVGGYTPKGLAHEWLNIYLDGKWYGLDPTWIDTYPNVENTLRNTGKSNFFMIDLETTPTFYKIHLEDVLPSKIVDPNAVIVDKIDTNNNEIYDYIFVIFVILLGLFLIVLIYNYLIRPTLKPKKKYKRKK